MNWISIKDQSPPFDEKVLVLLDVTSRNMGEVQKLTKYIMGARYCCKKIWEFDSPKVNSSPMFNEVVTHWMALPEIPGGGKSESRN